MTDKILSLFSRDRKLLMIAGASLLATLPVWLPVYPPMTDLPDHAAQIMLFRNLNDPSFPYSSFFQINWFTPYLLGYLLIYLLTPLAGIVLACKIVIAISVAALPVSTALVMDETGSDKYWALLVIPAMYGLPYYWGFLNFIVAAPLGMLFLWAAMRHVRIGSTVTALWLAILINVLFFAHALICVFFGLISACYMLVGMKSRKQAILRLSPLFTVIPMLVIWVTHSYSASKTPILWNLAWFVDQNPYYEWGRVSGFLPRLLGVEANSGSLLAGIIFFALPLLAGARLTRRFEFWIPLLICIAALLFAPSMAYSASLIYQRLTMFALPLFLILLEERSDQSATQQRRKFRAAAPVIVGVWIAVLCTRVMAYNSSASVFEEVLSQMKPNQRALSIHFVRDSSVSIAPAFLHFGSWYAAKKHGMADPNSAIWPVELVLFRPGKLPAGTAGFEWYPESFDWDRQHGEDYRYFIVSAPVDPGPDLFAKATCRISLRYHASIWWLYERDPNCLGGRLNAGNTVPTAYTNP